MSFFLSAKDEGQKNDDKTRELLAIFRQAFLGEHHFKASIVLISGKPFKQIKLRRHVPVSKKRCLFAIKWKDVGRIV